MTASSWAGSSRSKAWYPHTVVRQAPVAMIVQTLVMVW